MESTLQKRVHIGRQHETLCYRICYYLVQEEELALIAAQNVMKRLLLNDKLSMEKTQNITQYIKKEAMKESIQVIYSRE
jgi:hypothetical protein